MINYPCSNGGTDLSPSHGDDDGLFQREAEGLFTCSCNKENIDISQVYVTQYIANQVRDHLVLRKGHRGVGWFKNKKANTPLM